MSDTKITRNETMDEIFKYNFESNNPYLTVEIWTGIRLSSYSLLTDEFGTLFTFEEFFQKTTIKRFIRQVLKFML